MYLKDVKNIFKEKEISFKKEFLICYLLFQRIAPFLSAIYIKKRNKTKYYNSSYDYIRFNRRFFIYDS